MAIAGYVLGYASLGFAARCYALGIQKRNIFENFGGHAALMGLFGAAGYWLHGVEARQREIIAAKKEQIHANRTRLGEVVRRFQDERERAGAGAGAGQGAEQEEGEEEKA